MVASCMLELSRESAGDRKPSSNSLSSPAGNQSSINQFAIKYSIMLIIIGIKTS